MWTMLNTMSLIEDFRPKPCLWDTHSIEFKNRFIKSSELKLLADKYNVTPIDIEKKIQSLKSQFRREYKKIKEAEKHGEKIKCSWFGYEQMSFILNEELCENSIYDIAGVRHKTEKSESFDKEQGVGDGNLVDISMSEIDYSRDSQSQSVIHSERRPAVESESVDDIGKSTLQCMKSLIDVVTKRDEFSIYGEYIADKLRNCGRSSMEVHIAQHHLDNIVFNLIMGEYEPGVANVTSTDITAATSDALPNVALKEEKM